MTDFKTSVVLDEVNAIEAAIERRRLRLRVVLREVCLSAAVLCGTYSIDELKVWFWIALAGVAMSSLGHLLNVWRTRQLHAERDALILRMEP